MKEQNKTTQKTCLYIGLGCGVLVLLAVLALGGIGYWGYKKAEELKDPEKRQEKVVAILGTNTLPAGYFPVIGMSIPWVMDFAMITDKAPDAEGEIEDMGEHLFIYIKFLLKPGDEEQELRDFFEGRSDDPQVLEEANINIDVEEIVGRGTIPMENMDLLYVSTRGEVQADHGRSEGLSTIMLLECTDDNKMRFAIWIGPDVPDPEDGVEADLTGTPADEAEISRFMAQFSVCG